MSREQWRTHGEVLGVESLKQPRAFLSVCIADVVRSIFI